MFKRKVKLIDTSFFEGLTDCHSHILPSVDDGIQSMEEALATLKYYEHLGMKKVVFTPHINVEFSCDKDLHVKQFSAIKLQYNGDLELHLAAEYMLDSGFESQMQEGLRYVSDKRVLVETSYIAAPYNFNELLYTLASQCDIPLIAHPERYAYMNKDGYFNLKNYGCELQLNIMSLSGFYGENVKRKAIFLLENGMYDFVGTDIHSLSRFKNIVERIKITKKQVQLINNLK